MTRQTGGAGPVRNGVLWSSLVAALEEIASPRVIDVGGGTGALAVALAEHGCAVTVIDTSADALATLHRRADEAGIGGRVTGVQGDFDSLPQTGFDLVLCHSVLEYVDDPALAVHRLAERIRPGGTLSLLVANRAATVINRALSGHVRQASHALSDPDGRWGPEDGMQRRFDTDALMRQLTSAGLEAVEVHGIGVFADLMPALDREPGAAEELRLLEERLSAVAPYRDLASRLHVLARPSSAADVGARR